MAAIASADSFNKFRCLVITALALDIDSPDKFRIAIKPILNSGFS